MQAVKWVLVKLQGEKAASFCGEISGPWSRSYREIDQHPSLPWNFITHGFLQESVNGGFQTVVRVFWGNEIPLPPLFTSI